MTRFQEIALFIVLNIIGFYSPSICIYIGMKIGATDFASPNFLAGIMMTWATCALFSFSFFFIRDNGRYLFLLAPAIIPVLYGLSAL